MKNAPGVLLLRRVRWWAEGRARKLRNPAVDVSEDQLVRQYRGIDGIAWPEELSLLTAQRGALAPIELWPSILEIASSHTNGSVYDAIILAEPPCVWNPPPNAEYLGCDVGFYENDDSLFSSIYHEAIHGSLAELRRYACTLNDSLLFPTASEAEGYRQTRENLRHAGRDVEDMNCYLITIFGRRSPI